VSSFGPADLDVALEHIWVFEAERQRRDGHRLWDCAEVEYALVLEQPEVVERIGCMTESVENHRALYVLGLFLVSRHVHFLHFLKPRLSDGGTVLLVSPDFPWPEVPLVVNIFTEVTDDVCLLEEETHGIRELELSSHECALFARSREETREAFAHETRNIVAVEIILLRLFEVN
jgi:hypothetical protein